QPTRTAFNVIGSLRQARWIRRGEHRTEGRAHREASIAVNVYGGLRSFTYTRPIPARRTATTVGASSLQERGLIGIRDLAQYLNVSIGTVSRALNGKADV